MKKAFLIITIYFSLFIFHCFSQPPPQNWNWYFGDSAAINFSSGVPIAIAGCQMNQLDCSASISDTSGNLLFYTDGVTVWNKNNMVMPHGTGLHGNWGSTQSALIVPKPDSSTIYYIFTCAQGGDPYGINYSEVDMTLNGGLGDVTVKNIQLVTPAAEKLCAVKHCNGTDYWVIAHSFIDSSYYAYQVSSSGVSIPIISSIGVNMANNNADGGYLKVSPNGRKIASAIRFQACVQLFDFDNSSGILSNCISITNVINSYGISFSPDNTKLYASILSSQSLFQYDISSNNQDTINASQYQVASSFIGVAIQLGPDNKLYLAKVNSHFLDVINNPNISSAGCNYVLNAVNLDSGLCKAGLPNFIDAYAPLPPAPPISAFTVDTLNGCKPLVVHFTNNGTRATSYLWTFGNGDTSTLTNPIRTYNNSTFDTVTLIAYYTTPCGVFSDTSIQVFDFIVFDPPQQPIITLSHDTLYSSSLINNQWYKDSALLSGDTNNYYQPTQNGRYTIEVTDSNGCTAMSAPYSFYVGIGEVQNLFNSSPWLGNAYPNPFKDETEIPYYIPTICISAEIDIFDLLGNKIQGYSLNSKGILNTLKINSENYTGGFYFYILVVEGNKAGWKKLIIIK